MSTRQALLIGVPEYAFRPELRLPVVAQDIADVQRALEACNYHVRTLGIENPADATRNAIRRAIREACSGAAAESTLLILFTGHGIHHQGRDLLIPYDGDLEDDPADSLVSADLSDVVSGSPAATIVFFIDACREGVHWHRKAAEMVAWSSSEHCSRTGKGFATVFGCSRGQVSQYTGGSGGYSLFSRALATVLAPAHSARTLGEIVDAAQQELDRLVVQHNKRRQVLTWKGEQEVGLGLLQRVITDHLPESEDDSEDRQWGVAIRNSRLWTAIEAEEPEGLRSVLREMCGTVADRTHRMSLRAAAALPGDAWRDEAYQIRLLEQLEQLIYHGGITLTAGETSLVLISALVHEAIYSEALRELAAHSPLRLHFNTQSDDIRALIFNVPSRENHPMAKRFRLSQNSKPRLLRTAARLSRLGAAGQKRSEAIIAWMMHEFIAREPSLWRCIPGSLLTGLDSLPAAPDTYAVLITEILNSARLLELSRCVGCDPARVARPDSIRPLQAIAVVVGGGCRLEIREQLIAYLLAIAGWMALDSRNMPELVPSHLGADSAFNASDLVRTLRRARWQSLGSGRQLVVQCEHPAIDYALRDHVHRASDALEFVRGQTLSVSHLAPLGSLPTRLTADGVGPSRLSDGRESYELPHVSFTLDPDEIRELLMGQQLYSNPDLAIRELYQNALDACRYAAARIEYLKRRNDCPSEIKDWQGSIVFRSGRGKDGRQYLECIDNGVGMGKEELAGCFARAGRRFRDLPEFLEEQEQWFGCEPPIRMYPNSRFGIGVFSYFMLADDIEVETVRLDRHGGLGRRFVAQMSAGGGLFRIQDQGDSSTPGTKVRLYLKDARKPGFVSKTLAMYLFIAEYTTTVFDGKKRKCWKAGVPGDGESRALGVSPTKNEDIWWGRAGGGAILADGIRIGLTHAADSPKKLSLFDSLRWIYDIGVIVNLRGDNFPVLTVDRRSALKLDADWIRSVVLENLPAVLDSQCLSIGQLWLIQHHFPKDTRLAASRLVIASIEDSVYVAAKKFVEHEEYWFHLSALPKVLARMPHVRVDRLGVDKRDLAIFLVTILLIVEEDRRDRFRSIERALRHCGWIKRGPFQSYQLAKGNQILALYDLLKRAGALEAFSSRLRAWISEGFDPHPVLAGILLPVDSITYRLYRKKLRQYRRRQLIARVVGWVTKRTKKDW